MSEFNFFDIDSAATFEKMLADFENNRGITLYPGDERRSMLLAMLPVIIQLKAKINETAKRNLIKYADGELLDELAWQFYKVTRIPAMKAEVPGRVELTAIQSVDVPVEAGELVTGDGTLYFVVKDSVLVPAGDESIACSLIAYDTGPEYNDLTAGQIKSLVKPLPFVKQIVNMAVSSGGFNEESDQKFKDRLLSAPEGFSTAGPEGAYIFHAMSADVSIVDVRAVSPNPCEVDVIVLCENGVLPDQVILDRVTDALSPRHIRPLCDLVTVKPPTQVSYNIELEYFIAKENASRETDIRASLENDVVDGYKAWQCDALERSINPDELRGRMRDASAYRIDITWPVFTQLSESQVAKVGTVTLNYGGLI